MTSEILSIETIQKLARLDKENREYEKIICNFDKEINRLFNIIKRAYEYSLKNNLDEELNNILCLGLNLEIDNDKKL